MQEIIASILAKGDLGKIHEAILQESVTIGQDGSRYLDSAIGKFDCVRYVADGIEFQPSGREISVPMANEVLILPTSVSLCGTDIGLIEKARAGQLPAEIVGKVVGHEAAGFVVGVGADVKKWQIGQFVCLESHYCCGYRGHQSFNDCVMSGLSCDGIAGGIRGALNEDNSRADAYDGYWSNILAIPSSALPVELPLDVAENLLAPSTLESLGNLYMIMGQLETLVLTSDPSKTLLVVSGLGATGYPMAAVAKHYGFFVAGINPSASKRDFAKKQGAVDVAYETLDEVLVHKNEFENIVIVVTAGQNSAHEDAMKFLATQASDRKRKVAILFGLYSDPKQPIAGAPEQFAQVPQRDFVFSRQSFKTGEGVEVYGVCGRDLKSWQSLMLDLTPVNGEIPHLVNMLNAAQLQVLGESALSDIAQTLNQGAAHVESSLRAKNALKLVANLIKN
jgi:threonine dehydrogenase-like Zn-dependent dehydrogenase